MSCAVSRSGPLSLGRRPRPLWLRGDQVAGIVLARFIEHLFCRSGFNDPSVSHDNDPVGDPPDHAKVMGDEQHRKAAVAFQFGKQIEDLRLYRHIERRCGLVGDQQVRIVGKRHRNHHALALPARQLVRIGGQTPCRVGNADAGQQVDCAFHDLRR